MSDVTGSIRTLPGSRHKSPAGCTCDDCGAPAVIRIQGETDSSGSEMHDLCQSCGDKVLSSIIEDRESPKTCDWCHAKAPCRPYRDMEEGTCGPVYMVCQSCRDADAISYAEEFDDRGYDYDDYD